jgi:hypothetical protein
VARVPRTPPDRILPIEWKTLLACTAGADKCLRGGPDDGYFLALWLNKNDGEGLRDAGESCAFSSCWTL